MRKGQAILVSCIMILTVVLSSAAILAQESTSEPGGSATSEPSSFSDNRINEDIYLGGLALYCQDMSGNTGVNTFQDGGITLWGVGGQEYIVLSADQLRGDVEIDQPAMMEPAMTEEDMDMTEEPMMEATVDPSMTAEPMVPVLLARALTPNGQVFLYRVGDDTFALQGNDEYGKFYTYVWTGCSVGSISTDTSPFMETQMSMPMATAEMTAEPMMEDMSTPMPMEEMTPEATEAS